MSPIHTTDQLAFVRTAATERQRRADEYRVLRERETHPTNPRLAAISVTVATVLSTVVFGAIGPAGALSGTPEDTYTGTDQRLAPGMPDGFWHQPPTGPVVPARVR